jgi:NADH:ubiquinone oxidoreductase subunit 4 (subunit M)
MPIPSFHEWLNDRPDEALAADRLAMLIVQSGAAGISLDRLRTVLRLSPETLQDILKSLVATGQVTVLKVNGQMTYRGT